MIGFITLPIAAFAAYALGGLDYLRGLLLPPVPVTTPVDVSFVVPPTSIFNPSGRANGWYRVSISANLPNGFISKEEGSLGLLRSTVYSFQLASPTTAIYFVNGIQSGEASGIDGSAIISINWYFVEDETVINPIDPPSPSEDGIADSGDPDFSDDVPVITGAPIVPLPNFLPALAAAIAAVKAAIDALGAIKAIADAIEVIGDVLDKIKDFLDDIKKDRDDGNKQVTRHSFGSIKGDGYLRLYPSVDVGKKKCVYLDLIFQSIPIGYGKYFGKNSPNFYRFKSLGYVAFTAPTFGIMSVRDLEFGRMSLEVPENASGFYFHLGLDETIIANVAGYYEETIESEE